jgi:hypothetical protein
VKSIRAGSGLGDSLYLQSVARHLAARGEQLLVRSDFPDVFRPLAGKVAVAPFTRLGVDIVAHYTTRKGSPGTDQFQDACINAGIREQVELRLDWQVQNRALVDRVQRQAAGRPIVCLQLARAPMARTDGFGKELLPDCRVIQRIVDRVGEGAFVVLVGSGQSLFKFEGVGLDLSGQTSVADLIDVASIASGFVGYVSFIVPLAESLGKPALLVWSARGLRAPLRYVRQVTPQKVLHGQTCSWVMDDWEEKKLAEAVDAFRRKVGCGAVLRGEDGGDRRERAGLAA